MRRLLWSQAIIGLIAASLGPQAALAADATFVDPLTRYVHVTYSVPADAPDEVVVTCMWSPDGGHEYWGAKAQPFVSETASELAHDDKWKLNTGAFLERRAAGLQRTVVFNPYPQAQENGRVDVTLRIEIKDVKGKPIREHAVHAQVNNSDVMYVRDWTAALQKNAVTTRPTGERGCWEYRRVRSDEVDTMTLSARPTAEKRNPSPAGSLIGDSSPEEPLPQLTLPLNLRGWYAIYVCTPTDLLGEGKASIRLRLSGEERADTIGSRYAGEEVLWKWARLDRQNLILCQPHTYTGYTSTAIDYVKFVPLTLQQVEELESQFGTPDKIVAGYWEPYSWAFNEDVQTPAQHREPLSAFAWARIGLVDTQIGRVGMKVVYESRATDQLIYNTFGDPVPGNSRPETNNVGRMQQYTNTLENELRYAGELGLKLHANFGAGACYTGTPLQGDVSKQHPDWLRGNTLRYELPEVRAYVLSLYRESLDIGARGISIDFCRYPEGVDKPETANTLLRELRGLVDAYVKNTGRQAATGTNHTRIPILVRFPGKGVRLHDRFDYPTWAREGWVDYLCPSNIQGRHLHIDMTPYLEAVRGTSCKLLPALDGLGWGQPMPGPFFWRVQQLYDAGVPGIYVYQADARVLGRPQERRWMRMLASSAAIRQWWERDRRDRPRCSKGIYLSRPQAPDGSYHSYERVRLWLEGVEFGPMQIHVDGKWVIECDGPPYLLGTEEYESDHLVPPGRHELKVRARDGASWLEQVFTITMGK